MPRRAKPSKPTTWTGLNTKPSPGSRLGKLPSASPTATELLKKSKQLRLEQAQKQQTVDALVRYTIEMKEMERKIAETRRSFELLQKKMEYVAVIPRWQRKPVVIEEDPI